MPKVLIQILADNNISVARTITMTAKTIELDTIGNLGMTDELLIKGLVTEMTVVKVQP